MPELTDKELNKLLETIGSEGIISEVDLQVKIRTTRTKLKPKLEELKDQKYVKRIPNFFKGGYGDGFELTEKGQKHLEQ